MERYFRRPRLTVPKDQTILTGNVQAKPAAADEERYAIALTKQHLTFWFRLNPTNVPIGLPGSVELDFLVEMTGLPTMQHSGLYKAIEIDDLTFIHFGQRKKADMIIKDQKRIEGLARWGIQVPEIIHVDAARLSTQQGADQAVKEIL